LFAVEESAISAPEGKQHKNIIGYEIHAGDFWGLRLRLNLDLFAVEENGDYCWVF
jgi:hypothetical protein